MELLGPGVDGDNPPSPDFPPTINLTRLVREAPQD